MNKFEKFFEKYKFVAPLFLRLAFGYHLIQYTYGDIFEGTAGTSNSEWLGSKGVPFPYLMGWIYILTEFFGGIALIIGFKTRYFALLLTINFIVALAIVHIGDTYKNSFDAIHMLVISIFFLFNGAGNISIDNNYLAKKEE
jgi:putative oxidoreductase